MASKCFRRSAMAGALLMMLIPANFVLTGFAASMPEAEPTPTATPDPSAYKIEDEQALHAAFEEGNLLFFFGGTANATLTEADDDGVLDESGEQGDGEISTNIQEKGRIMGTNIKLRADTNTDAQILAALNEGITVEVISTKDNWYQVRFGILEGYVRTDLVFVLSDDGRNGTILQDAVNMLSEPKKDAGVVSTLSGGCGVQVTDYENGYYKVTYQGKTGYVQKSGILVTGPFTGEQATRMLKKGMSGDAVVKAQKELSRRGFFVGDATGDYGPKTAKAVADFQKAAKLTADGVAGEETLKLLYGNNNIKLTISEANQVKGRVRMTEWNQVNKIIPRGATYKIIDVRTGVSWNGRRLGGWLHIDTEPLTAEDTAKMKRVYGGRWSWNRRAVWVVYGSYVFAASINGMPHGGQSIGNNNFNGHSCIHFYKSKTHVRQTMDPAHQAAVKQAYNAGQ